MVTQNLKYKTTISKILLIVFVILSLCITLTACNDSNDKKNTKVNRPLTKEEEEQKTKDLLNEANKELTNKGPRDIVLKIKGKEISLIVNDKNNNGYADEIFYLIKNNDVNGDIFTKDATLSQIKTNSVNKSVALYLKNGSIVYKDYKDLCEKLDSIVSTYLSIDTISRVAIFQGDKPFKNDKGFDIGYLTKDSLKTLLTH